ncbi:DUF722 domain-containing protein [Leuconostoc gelidum subsp. gasicomitatum]|uniref:RinA family protein n=1 Tax=Leuconostoc gasicomitatum TaxID=115778 RepID=UPI001CC75E15|nr:RinA family protein [Leuconostoc gasicomitatum]MBZ5995365.1 DUF722 domain-containing protein [Leuconostoc gasicomitatum]
MADKIDKLLSDYYSGYLLDAVRNRTTELETPVSNDENIGGGRAQNKHTRPVDDLLIRKEEDIVLNKCRADLSYAAKLVTGIERSFSWEIQRIVRLHYDKRLDYDWMAIEDRTAISARQGQRYVQWFKREVGNVFWYDSDKKTSVNFIKHKATLDDLQDITSLIKTRLNAVDN